MATRRKTSKGRGGSSGGANPRNSREISEQQHEEAMRILRAEYFQGVRGIVGELQQAIKDGEITSEDELNERVHQDVDSSHWVIYTYANFQVLLVSDNHDAYSEEYGEAPVEGSDIKWAALAFAAMERDVRDLMGAEGVSVPEGGLEEAPRGKQFSARGQWEREVRRQLLNWVQGQDAAREIFDRYEHDAKARYKNGDSPYDAASALWDHWTADNQNVVREARAPRGLRRGR